MRVGAKDRKSASYLCHLYIDGWIHITATYFIIMALPNYKSPQNKSSFLTNQTLAN